MERHVWMDGKNKHEVICVKCGQKKVVNKDSSLLPVNGCQGNAKGR